jgi:1-deoxy-D-xylulose-5-phosphate reductoisomerase
MSIKKKLKIGIVGSTGSVGKTSLNIISKYPKDFKVELLVCDKDYRAIILQIKKFAPKYVFINNVKSFNLVQNKIQNKKIIILNDYKKFQKILNLQFDKIILAIPSTQGLRHAFFLTKYSRQLLVANKESIVCGGKVLLNVAKMHKCQITSIDSEHYCIEQSLLENKIDEIDSVYLTASGGPFLGMNARSYSRASIKKVTDHPRWNMGNKISVDSATLVNKIFESIEAHVLFGIPANKIKIKIHKESLVHSAIVLKNGLVKLIAHDTTMLIPIRNSLFDNKFSSQKNNFFNSKKKIIFNFQESNLSEFLIVKTGHKVLKMGHRAWILFNVINDSLVTRFLNKEIYFYEIVFNLIKIFKKKSITLYCNKKIKTLSDIEKTIVYGKKIFNKL